VAEVLHDTGLAPALLELEVTESAVMEDPEGAGAAASPARTGGDPGHRRLWHRLFLLLRLKRLPVQKLKIDQGFVAGLP
jgi:EAL domain-containing protein (putative c-di-GMP-specific phosphodiesterase class I)